MALKPSGIIIIIIIIIIYLYVSLRNFITLANIFCNFLKCIPTYSRGEEGVASYSETLYIRA